MQDCIFCKIIRGDLVSTKIIEDEHLIVIQDIQPQAPIHYLIIPKEHIQDVQSMKESNLFYAESFFAMAQRLSENVAGAQDFKLHINSGKKAGQIVMHLHMHFIAGKLSGAL